VKRLVLVAMLAATGCGEVSQLEPGPLDTFYFPVGIGVADGRLLVASSNLDLRYDDETGGSLIVVDPGTTSATLTGGLNIRSFASDVAVADRTACGLPETLALVPVRGANVLYAARVAPDGSLSCPDCEISLANTGFVDPFAVGVACGGGVSKAYVGYLRSTFGEAWITEIDLAEVFLPDAPVLRNKTYGLGRLRDVAFEAARKRLWLLGASGGIGAPLRWVDLLDECTFEAAPSDGGCRSNVTPSGTFPVGLEFESIALANDAAAPRRAYLTARRFDPAVAAVLGAAAPDLGGALYVLDLVEDAAGAVTPVIVRSFEIGNGAGKVRVLPPRPGKRDVVAALAADDGVLWIYDDETGDRTALGRDAVTGAPAVGHQAFGLAVDSVTFPGNVARVYVGSFQDGYVTPVDVPLDAPWTASIPQSGGANRRITGGTP